MSKIKLQVWDRQPEETHKSFDAFLQLRNMPPNDRGLKQLAKLLNVSIGNVGKWSTKYHWMERVAAYDTYIDREITQQKRINDERAKVEMLDRHTRSAVFIQNQVIARYQRMTQSDWDKINPVQCAQVFGQMAQFERLSRGLPTDSIELRTEEQIKRQQITEARLFFAEIKYDFPTLTTADHLAITCEAYEVTPEEIGYNPNAESIDGKLLEELTS